MGVSPIADAIGIADAGDEPCCHRVTASPFWERTEFTPPFRRDALGPFGLHHAARHAPPGEARGRAFRDLGKHGQRLGPRKEQRRTRRLGRSLLGPRDGPASARSQRLAPAPAYGLLVGSSRRTARRSSGSPGGRSAALACSRSSLLAKLVWAGSRALGHQRCQHHQIDAEADVDASQTLSSNRAATDAAARGEGALKPASIDGGGAVGAIEAKLRRRAPRPARARLGAELSGEMIEAGDDAFMGDERLREGQPRRDSRAQGSSGSTRLLALSERLIEPKQHGLGRSLREWNRRSSEVRGRS